MNGSPAPVGHVSNGFDLLRIRWIRSLVLWRGSPYVFQAAALAVFLVLAAIGWGHMTPEGVNTKLYAKTNLVTLVIWGLWWPSMIWATVFLGRIWCAVCPAELVSNLAERLGRALGVQPSRLPRWLAGGALVLVLFAVLQLLIPGIQLHRMPAYTSVFLWLTLAGAVLTGILFKDRAFCRGFCPVALLLNAYGRGGVLAVRGASGEACASCADRGCTAERNRYKADGRSCPSLLNPPKLDNNADCLLCGQCFKSCTRGSLRLLLRAPYSAADAREPLASWPLTLFVMVVSGFVTYELCGVWKAADPVFLWVPNRLREALGAGAWGGWIQAVWTVVAVPLLIWLALGAATRLGGGARSLGEAWRRLALPAAVVVAAGHMAKGLEKFTSWAGFLPHALREPDGIPTVLRMHAKAMPQPSAWLTPPVLSVACLLLMVAAVFVAVREARLADATAGRGRILPLLLLGAFYLFLVTGWGQWGWL